MQLPGEIVVRGRPVVGLSGRLLARALALDGGEIAGKQAGGVRVRRTLHDAGAELSHDHRLGHHISDGQAVARPAAHHGIDLAEGVDALAGLQQRLARRAREQQPGLLGQFAREGERLVLAPGEAERADETRQQERARGALALEALVSEACPVGGDVRRLRALAVEGDGVDDIAGEAHPAVEGDVAAVDLEHRPVERRRQVALRDRQMPGHRVPIDVDLVAAGARLRDRLGGDVVVAEDLHVDARKHPGEARRYPVDLAPVRTPDGDAALLLCGLMERLDLRCFVPTGLGGRRHDAEDQSASGALHGISPGTHALSSSATLASLLSRASDSTIGGALKKTRSRPIVAKMGHSAEGQQRVVAAMEDVLEVYTRPRDSDRPLVCLDETSKQLIAETARPPDEAGAPGSFRLRVRAQRNRHLFMLFAPLEGWRHVKVTDRHTAVDYAHVLKELADNRFPEPRASYRSRTISTSTTSLRSTKLSCRGSQAPGRTVRMGLESK